MKRRWLVATLGAAVSLYSGALVMACATDGEAQGPSPDETNTPLPAVTADAGTDADAACVRDDCEYYPAECTDDALCYGGLFDPAAAEDGLDLRTHISAVAARSPSDAWLAGTVGQLARFDGTAWTASTLGNQQSLLGLWLHRNAEIAFDQPTRIYTRGLDAGSDAAMSADGWAFFGGATIAGQWSAEMQVAATWAHPEATSLWVGVGAYAQRGNNLWRMRYSSETTQFTFEAFEPPVITNFAGREIYGIHGISPDELWAVGSRGSVFRISEAESATPRLTVYNSTTSNALEGVWVAATNDVWAVGATGVIRRYRGDARFWEAYDEVPTQQHLRAISGSSANDIWIVGDEATAFHYDGTRWQRMKIAGLGTRRPRLEHVWVPSPGKVWIAGQGVLVSLGGKP